MSDDIKPKFDTVAYWNNRYETVDLSRSGHIDLPGSYNAWLYRRKQAHLVDAIRKSGSTLRGKRLLEIAAGSGAYLAFWKSQGISEYFGIDLSERAIASLNKRFPHHQFRQFDLNDSGLAHIVGTGYDCISAMDVLYHVIDDERFSTALTDLASVLEPGGLLVIHDQFLHGPASEHGGYIKWRSLQDYENFLNQTGFDILYRRATFFFMIQNADYKGFFASAMKVLWDRICCPLIERFPRFCGATGYVIDTAICSVVREGPSMEIMVCQKRV